MDLLNTTQMVDSLDYSIVIVSNSFFEDHSSNSVINLLDSRFSNIASYGPFSLIVYQAKDYRNDILSEWRSALSKIGEDINVLPSKVLFSNSSISTSPFQSSDVIALSFTPEPSFIFGYGVNLFNMQNFTSFVEDSLQNISPSIPVITYSEHGNQPAVAANSIKVKFIGQEGWFETKTDRGFNEALYKYCEGQAVINGKTYYWFVSNVTHQAQGYSQWLGGWKAWKYQDLTNWSLGHADQIACSNAPTGSGHKSFSSNCPLFTISASISFDGFSLGITYPIYYGDGPDLNWRDSSNLGEGCVDTHYRLGICADTSTTYTVHSISIGLLNPTKPGGGMPPMEIRQEDPACLQSYWDDSSCCMPYDLTCCYLYPNCVAA